MSSSLRSPSPPALNPSLVRAWFDTVLNPLLSELEVETDLLKRNDATWRGGSSNRLASFDATRNHVSREARPNFDQFVQLYPECTPYIDKHDEALRNLHQTAGTYFDGLQASNALHNFIQELTPGGQYRDKTMFDVFGSAALDDQAKLIAEYIVNDVHRLPQYYTTSEFWNRHAEQFFKIAQSGELKSKYDDMRKATAEMLAATEGLIAFLTALRNQISLEAGVPIFAGGTR